MRAGSILPSFAARRRRWQKITIALLLGCALLAVAADLAAGAWIRTKISSFASHRLHTHASVSIGGAPALADVVNDTIPSTHIQASSATLCAITDADVSATVTDLHREDSHFAVSSTSAHVMLGAESLTNMITKRLPSATVQPDPAADTIDVHAGPLHAITLSLRPELSNHRLTVSLTQATVLGRPLPASVTSRLQPRLNRVPNLGHLPLDLSARHVAVANQGLELDLSGGPWHSTTHAFTQTCHHSHR